MNIKCKKLIIYFKRIISLQFKEPIADNNQETFIPRKSENTNRSETAFQWLPVGTNQYLAAGFKEQSAK
jgi:hypothetical protein